MPHPRGGVINILDDLGLLTIHLFVKTLSKTLQDIIQRRGGGGGWGAGDVLCCC